MEDISVFTLLWLFLLALIAGIVDAMAGGSGLLTLPGLLSVGLNPIAALATNKVQSIFGSFSAMLHFWRKNQIKLRDHVAPAFAAYFGAVAGAMSVTYSNPQMIKALVPFLLIAIAFWVLFTPQLGHMERKARISSLICSMTFIPAIGFYDGFFGPGTGTFFAIGLVSLLGVTLHQATMRAKIYNFATNLGAVSFFLFSGQIQWSYAAIMAVGTFCGGNIGARFILKHGTNLIRPVLVVVSLTMSIKLLWQQGLLKFLFN